MLISRIWKRHDSELVWRLRPFLCCMASRQQYLHPSLRHLNSLDCHMMVDLMSLTSIGDDRPPIWLFLSVSFGWIAHADLGTDKMRYFQIISELTLDGLAMSGSQLVLHIKWFSGKNTNALLPPTELRHRQQISTLMQSPNALPSRPSSETSTTNVTIEGKSITFVQIYPRTETLETSLTQICRWINGNMQPMNK